MYSKLGVVENTDSDIRDECTKRVKIFLTNLRAKWVRVSRSNEKFRNKYALWLRESIIFQIRSLDSSAGPSRSGRPLKDFENLSDQSKRRRVQYVIDNYTYAELAYAARISLHAAGHRDAAGIIKDLTGLSLDKANEMKKVIHSTKLQPDKYTPNEALSLYVDGRLSKYSYTLIQQEAKKKMANIYPPYNVLLRAKKECYPDKVTVTDTTAEVELQALLNHTIQRLALVQEEVLSQNMEQLNQGLTLVLKWGCDGSSGHSNYKQSFEGEQQSMSDSSLISICLVPLQLKTNDGKLLLWNNSNPSSTRFCRPIKLSFEKETTDVIKREIESLEGQISALQPSIVQIGEVDVRIGHLMKMTMIDGKTFGVVSSSSVQTCGICSATPKMMNELDTIYDRVADETKYEYGLSSLHAYIRCLECILHIAYRINIKTWRVTGEAQKKIFEETKKSVQQKIKDTMHMTVDMPKQGFGSSNDGNTANRFFEQFSLAASATGVDEELIRRFGTILNCISSGFSVNYEAFAEYAKATARRYVELYAWYPMPSSVHKLLIHGADIIKSCSLPIGMMSEEALEARNKDLRRYREFNTRKTSRKNTMQDLLNSLLISSDPLISSLSKDKKRAFKKQGGLRDEVLMLLAEPEIAIDREDDDEDLEC